MQVDDARNSHRALAIGGVCHELVDYSLAQDFSS